ncbi:hypothetical protein [Paractinoplanes atraurantiacus]|uniref:hypothetical protein n=1 Tax=Paractinoplanes atraurantiacus TaxID=1036182 RepID=UPI001178BB96|nr:hypothetical protein [Actinoplanes atraurantiacus]
MGHWRLVGGRRGLVLVPAHRPRPWYTPELPQPRMRDGARVGPPVGRATPAGWSFAGEAPERPPVIGFFVVDARWDPIGFEVEGRQISPALFAAHLAALGTTRPILLSPHRPEGSPAASRRILIELCQAFGRPVTTAEGTIRYAADGTASTDGAFRRWHPAPRPAEDLGSILPAPAVAYSGDAEPRPPRTETVTPAGPAGPVAVGPGWAGLLDVRGRTRSPKVAEPRPPVRRAPEAGTAASSIPHQSPASTTPAVPVGPAVEMPPAPVVPAVPMRTAAERPAPVAGPVKAAAVLASGAEAATIPAGPAGPGAGLWLPDAEPAVDPAAVRETLGRSYDAHARVVARLLSENPGLRAVAGPSTAATAGLVAVRSYLLDENAALNAALRGETPVDETRALLLAVTARHGLVRLPSVFGPVFRNLPADPDVTVSYRPGEELEEPGFVDVDLVPAAGDGVAIEFAIWSTSARRVGGLGAGESAALFPPGSRFSVLAVDEPADRTAPVRVLLRDLATTGRGRAGPESVDRVVTRLREVARPSGVIRPAGRAGFPIGVDRQQRRFRRGAPAHLRPSGSGPAFAERMERA